jgi:hypothetical protein
VAAAGEAAAAEDGDEQAVHAFLALILRALASPARRKHLRRRRYRNKAGGAPPKQRSSRPPEAAADTLTEALRKDDDKTFGTILGRAGAISCRAPARTRTSRARLLKAWDENHKLVPTANSKMLVEVGTTGFNDADPDRQGSRGLALRRRGRARPR